MESIAVTKSRFKYAGLFMLGAYYDMLYDTFRSKGYHVDEFRYRQVMKPDGTPGELELFWNCYKHIDDYCVIKIFAKTLIVGLDKKQTQIDGKAMDLDKGVVELEMKCEVVLDKLNQWDANPMMIHLRPFYDTYFYKNALKNITAKATDEHNWVENQMKGFFNMQNV
jgi:hypothetical protein